MLTRLRWYWLDLVAEERGLGNFWDRHFLHMWLVISILTIL